MSESKDPERIVGQTEVTEADLRGALVGMRGSQRPWVMPGLFIGAALIYAGLRPEGYTLTTLVGLLLPAAVVGIGMTYLQRTSRQAWVEQALASIGGPTTFVCDEFGFHSESKLRQHRLAWAALARMVETADAFLVYTTPQTVLIVPKRAFPAEQLENLRKMLAERIAPDPSKSAAGDRAERRRLLLWVLLIVAFLSIWHVSSIE